MDQRPKLMIYDRREIWVLLALIALVTLFSFTLGVHLGKRVGTRTDLQSNAAATHTVETQADVVPSNQELADQSKKNEGETDEALNQALHEEVARTGLRLNTGRQVELPEGSKHQSGGETTLESQRKKFVKKLAPSEELSEAAEEQSIPAFTRPTPDGKYTLQVGSFPSIQEATKEVNKFDELGLKPFLRSVEIKGRGKWYRIYVGGFSSRIDAEKVGSEYQSKQLIQTFIVSKLSDSR